jgi:WD40 repeat protein
LDGQGDPLPEGALGRLGSTRYRGPGYAAALSPDGKLIALLADDDSIKLVDAATGRELARLDAAKHGGEGIGRLCFSPDGTALASLGMGGRPLLWDVKKRAFLRKVDVSIVHGSGLVFSGDGKVIATGSAPNSSNKVAAWDVETGKLLGEFPAEQCIQVSAILSPDGKTLATFGYHISNPKTAEEVRKPGPGQTIQFWDIANVKERSRIVIDDASANSFIQEVAYSPNGKMIAVLIRNESIQLYDVESGKRIHRLGGRRSTSLLSFTSDGKELLGAGYDGSLIRWDVETGKRLSVSETSSSGAAAVVITADGRVLQWGKKEQAFRLWDVKAAKALISEEGHVRGIGTIVYSPDGKKVFTGSYDGCVCVWDASTRRVLHQWAVPLDPIRGVNRTEPLIFSGDGRFALVGIRYQGSTLHEIESGKETGVVESYAAYPTSQSLHAFSPNGRWLAATGGSSPGIRLFDVDSGGMAQTLKGELAQTQCIAFSGDGKTVAVRGTFRTEGDAGLSIEFRVFETSSGKERHRIKHATTNDQQGMAMTADGKSLIAGDAGRTIKIWDTGTGVEVRSLSVAGLVSVPLVLSPNQHTLATVGYDRNKKESKIQLWELTTGVPRREITVPGLGVLAVAFSPDGRTLATGNADTTVTLWDLTGRAGTKTEALTADDADSLWSDLASADAAKADAAIWRLSDAPKQTLPLLKKHLKPVAPSTADAKQIAQWIAELSHEDFDTRDKANHELEQVAAPAKEALQKTLDGGKLPAEAKRRVEALLDAINKPATIAADMLAPFRALEILEHVSTPEAKELLTKLAKGRSDALLTREAKAALERMDRTP